MLQTTRWKNISANIVLISCNNPKSWKIIHGHFSSSWKYFLAIYFVRVNTKSKYFDTKDQRFNFLFAEAKCDLTICRLTETSGPVAGGKEILLFCDKISKDDIQVRFFEEKNDQLVWEGFGDFQPSDVHKQYGICFRTPRYKNIEVKYLPTKWHSPCMTNIFVCSDWAASPGTHTITETLRRSRVGVENIRLYTSGCRKSLLVCQATQN